MKTKSKANALDDFTALKIRIDESIRKLSEMSEDHFDVSPENVHFGHVGTLTQISEYLDRACRFAGK